MVDSQCSLNAEEGSIDGKEEKGREERTKEKGFSLWLNILSEVPLSPKSLSVRVSVNKRSVRVVEKMSKW